MKLCCLGDIHYTGSINWLYSLIDSIASKCIDAEVAVVVGDVTSNGSLSYLHEFLSLLRGALTVEHILIVPGNHDIYVMPEEVDKGINSLLKLQMFNSLVRKLRCTPLMEEPLTLDNVGFVGTIGWYDYSFAPDWLGLSLEDFKAKAFGLSIWADRDYVKLPFTDEEFTSMLLKKLEEDIKRVYDKVDRIVVVMHHVPFREIVTYRLKPEWDYFSTFMGSEAFEYLIERYRDKVKLVLHGHSHDGVKEKVCKEVKGVNVCKCASPYPMILEV